MTDDPKLFRERAAIERARAGDTLLANVRDRALYAADRWDSLAHLSERIQAASSDRRGRLIG